MQSKIKEAVLRKIRSRAEESPAEYATRIPALSPEAAASVSVRAAQFSDFERVCAVNRRLGQGADSVENWQRLWRDNPALLVGNRTPRIGWVLEASDEIVGFLGSIPLTYEFEGQTLAAAATCRFAVEPVFRGLSHILVTSFFRQKDVDLFLNTTATVAAGKIMVALRAAQVPQPHYGAVLFWVLKPQSFLKSVLRKPGVGGGLSSMGGYAASLPLRADILLRRRKPKRSSGEYRTVESELAAIGTEFEAFWAARSANGSQLFASRSNEIMRWHFDPPGSRRVSRMIGCYWKDLLVGYAVVRHDALKDDGLHRSVIADLMTNNDPAADIADCLLAASYASASNAGSDVLEVIGFPASVRDTLLKQKPYSRDYPLCPFFFKARERALQEKLASESVWYASPFDGDATLWP